MEIIHVIYGNERFFPRLHYQNEKRKVDINFEFKVNKWKFMNDKPIQQEKHITPQNKTKEIKTKKN